MLHQVGLVVMLTAATVPEVQRKHRVMRKRYMTPPYDRKCIGYAQGYAMDPAMGGSARGSPAIWQQQQPHLPPPGGLYSRQVGTLPPAPQRSPSGFPPVHPGSSGDIGGAAAGVHRSGSGADTVAGGRSASAMGGDLRFDMAAAPSSSADNSIHGGAIYPPTESAGSFPGPLAGAGPSDALSGIGSGGGSGSQMRQSSVDSFGTWPQRGGSEGSQPHGLPPSVRTWLLHWTT